jgi:CspA family cold shock protein
MRGTIVRTIPIKGFGFIMGEDGFSRFAHATEFEDQVAFESAREGQKVEFTPIEAPKGKRATKVKVLRG